MGRGDDSIAIGSNMHMTIAWGVARTLEEFGYIGKVTLGIDPPLDS